MNAIEEALAKAAEKEKYKKEMENRIKELFGEKEVVVVTSPGAVSHPEEEATEESVDAAQEEYNAKDPLEEAIERAIFSVGEIKIFADYNRAGECRREAEELLVILNDLKQKWDEQNAIMDALSGKTPTKIDPSYMDEEFRAKGYYLPIDEDE